MVVSILHLIFQKTQIFCLNNGVLSYWSLWDMFHFVKRSCRWLHVLDFLNLVQVEIDILMIYAVGNLRNFAFKSKLEMWNGFSMAGR